MVNNRLTDFIKLDKSSIQQEIKYHISKMKQGSVVEHIIANAAEGVIKNVNLLRQYQDSDECDKFFWGRCFAEADGKLYYLTDLRYLEDDFEKSPFNGFEIVGKRKYRTKCRMHPDDFVHGGDISFTWHFLKNAKPIKLPAYFKITLENK